jgi:KDO2-lipid IV(A) lauroyltransferase
MLFISGHFGNWEVLPFAARDSQLSGASVVRPTNNPFVNRWLERQRTTNGLPELIAKAQGARRIFTLLRKGDIICMLVDQRASEGVNAPFLGREAPTTPVPAALALKLGVAIIPVSNTRLNGAHFRVTVYPPIQPANTGNHDRDMLDTTAAINRFIEARVLENPSQWLWMHRRWATPGAKLRKRGAQTLSGATMDPAGNSPTSNRV